MKRFENLILKACAYTVLIVVLFFLFTLATDFTEAAIKIGTFMLIFLFGSIISAANLILELVPSKRVYKVMIHYFTLLVAFTFIFIVSGRIVAAGVSAIFVAVVLFTFFYAIIFLIASLIKKSVTAADKKFDKKHPKKTVTKKEYKSLYK